MSWHERDYGTHEVGELRVKPSAGAPVVQWERGTARLAPYFRCRCGHRKSFYAARCWDCRKWDRDGRFAAKLERVACKAAVVQASDIASLRASR